MKEETNLEELKEKYWEGYREHGMIKRTCEAILKDIENMTKYGYGERIHYHKDLIKLIKKGLK